MRVPFTPNRCILSLLVAEALLWLYNRLGWLARYNGCGRAECWHASWPVVYNC
ncbi:MAG: hypothetical protein ABSG53_14920 [Thermoguttaceae bacterium]